jgi:hypothetical protein
LHAPETAAALAREQHNAAELEKRVREDERIVHTFPTATPGSDRRTPSEADTAQADKFIAPGHRGDSPSFQKAERFCAAEAAVGRARERRASTKSEAARHEARAVDITKLSADEEPAPVPAKAPRSWDDFLR